MMLSLFNPIGRVVTRFIVAVVPLKVLNNVIETLVRHAFCVLLWSLNRALHHAAWSKPPEGRELARAQYNGMPSNEGLACLPFVDTPKRRAAVIFNACHDQYSPAMIRTAKSRASLDQSIQPQPRSTVDRRINS